MLTLAGWWRGWRRMSAAARAATLMAIVLLPLIEISLRVAGLVQTFAWLRSSASWWRTRPAEPRVLRLAVERASRRGAVTGRCLSQSLALWWLLTSAGVSSRLRLGVAYGDQGLDAHAWVENDAGALNDSPDVRQRYPASFVTLG